MSLIYIMRLLDGVLRILKIPSGIQGSMLPVGVLREFTLVLVSLKTSTPLVWEAWLQLQSLRLARLMVHRDLKDLMLSRESQQ